MQPPVGPVLRLRPSSQWVPCCAPVQIACLWIQMLQGCGATTMAVTTSSGARAGASLWSSLLDARLYECVALFDWAGTGPVAETPGGNTRGR